MKKLKDKIITYYKLSDKVYDSPINEKVFSVYFDGKSK